MSILALLDYFVVKLQPTHIIFGKSMVEFAVLLIWATSAYRAFADFFSRFLIFNSVEFPKRRVSAWRIVRGKRILEPRRAFEVEVNVKSSEMDRLAQSRVVSNYVMWFYHRSLKIVDLGILTL